MSMAPETAMVHSNVPAVTCCRCEAGTVIGPAHLEDPTLFPEFERAGFLHIPAHCLTRGQVLGAPLPDTVDGFTPLTPERVVRGQATITVRGETAPPAAPIPRQAKRLVQKHIPIDQVKMGPETAIAGKTLYIRDSLCQDVVRAEALVTAMTVDIINGRAVGATPGGDTMWYDLYGARSSSERTNSYDQEVVGNARLS